MPNPRRFDHIVLAAKSLDALAAQYEALGFTLTPRAYHEDRMGTSNRLAQFSGKNFIELLEVDRPDGIEGHDFAASPPRYSFGEANKAFLERGEGMSALVLTTEDARADHAAFLAQGLDTYEPFYFERKAKLPDGSEVTVAFSLTFVTSPTLPGLTFFFCQQHAPEYFWKPQYQSHENGAEDLVAVTIAAEEPAAQREFLAKLTGGETQEIAGGYSLEFGGHELLVMTPEAVRDAHPGCGVRDGEPSFAGITLRNAKQQLPMVPADDAGGLFLAWR